jgi:hypothetical protein
MLSVQKVVLETDSTGLAAKLLRDEHGQSLHGPLVEKMKSLLRSFGDTRSTGATFGK